MIWSGGSSLAKYGLLNMNQEIPGEWTEIIIHGLKTATMSTLQFCFIAIPFMVLIQILQDIDFIHRFTKWMSFFIKPLGIEERGSITLTSGLLFGLMFGAGIMIQQVQEKKFEKRDLTIIMIFLALCHAVVEDTAVFIPLNTYLIPLIIIRFAAAIVFSLITAWILLPKSRSSEVRIEKTGSG
jgi:Fe2+ transport system protein B